METKDIEWYFPSGKKIYIYINDYLGFYHQENTL